MILFVNYTGLIYVGYIAYYLIFFGIAQFHVIYIFTMTCVCTEVGCYSEVRCYLLYECDAMPY